MSLGRRLPNSTESHYVALKKAKERKDNPPASGNIISVALSLRLDNAEAAFSAARTDVFIKQANSSKATAEKDVAVAEQRMLNSQYIQVLNFKIDRGLIPESSRSYFGITISSGAVPHQRTDSETETVGQNIIDGEALMIAAGGAAIPYPIVLEISTQHAITVTKINKHLNALDALDVSKETILALNPEAGAVVKKVWDEVETNYDEGTVESRRKNARLWGVVYINTGDPVTIAGHIMEMVNGAPVPVVGAKASILESEETATSGSEGALSLKTALVGTITIRLSMDTFADKDLIMDIDSAKNVDLGIIVMVKMVK